MTRRARLPGADELFRSTEDKEPPMPAPQPAASRSGNGGKATVEPSDRRPPKAKPRHEEKVTYYCSADALTRLEAARLNLRADHDITCDRGRIVRAALDEVLDDFAAEGERSALIRRLMRPE